MKTCSICSALFPSHEELQTHVLASHKNEVVSSIKYQCTACLKSWANYHTLRKHQLTCGVSAGSSGSAHASDEERSDFLGHTRSDPLDNPTTVDDAAPDDAAPDNAAPVNAAPDDACSNEPPDLFTSPEQQLQQEVVELFRDLEDTNTTQATIKKMVLGFDKIIKSVLSVVGNLMQETAGPREALSITEALDILDDLKLMTVFDGLEKRNEFIDYLENYEGLIKPEKIVLEEQQEIHNQEVVVKEKDCFYLVPFLPQLEQLLSCPDVLKCVENPLKPEDWTYVTVTNGASYVTHPLVVKGHVPLCILLYFDGVDPSDTASARSGKNNMVFLYWTLGNIYPEFRTSDNAVQLYAIIKSDDLKKYGYQPVLKNLVESINRLSSEEGVTLNLKTHKKQFHGVLQCSLGDFPAQGAIGEFKQSVTAKKPCRECYVSNDEDYIQISDSSQFQLRNLVLHMQHLKALEDYDKLPARERALQPNPSVEYGVNGRSVLLDIKNFDVTKSMPQDLLHCAHEGVLAHLCHLILQHVVVDKKVMTIEQVNSNINVLARAFPTDRPGVIKVEQLAPDKCLRQTASQMRVLSLILPFALQVNKPDGSVKFAGDEDYLTCYIKFSQIMHFCLAHKFHITDVDRWRKKIEIFHAELLVLDPNVNMAKVHFLHHLPDTIILHGGIRQVACFRFEGHHAFFKRQYKILHNNVNPMKSLAIHHQIRKCNQMKKPDYLYGGHKYSIKMEVTHLVDRHVATVKEYFPNLQKITEISRLQVIRTIYKPGSIILLSETEPEFAIVKRMFMVGLETFCFICQKAKTRYLDSQLNAYHIAPLSTILVVEVKNLIHPHPIVSLIWKEKQYAITLGHRKLLTEDN